MTLRFRCLLLLVAPAFAYAFVQAHRVIPASSDARPAHVTIKALRGGVVAAALPSVPALAATSLLPTCLGLWKTGYAVSYGYGGAMFAAGTLMLRCELNLLARAHALALCFYGLRLNLFLLYRELFLPVEVHQMKQRDASLSDRLKRLPVIVGCSFLYYCMAAPLRITALATWPVDHGGSSVAAAVALAFVGFAVAALGDVFKTVVKAKKGPGHLVTGGPFRWLRHPNYTGEIFGWSASAIAALLLAALQPSGSTFLRSFAPWILASLVGWAGIFGVLAGEATAGLEKKQRERYGGTPEYEAWVTSSWAGPMVSAPQSGARASED